VAYAPGPAASLAVAPLLAVSAVAAAVTWPLWAHPVERAYGAPYYYGHPAWRPGYYPYRGVAAPVWHGPPVSVAARIFHRPR